MGSSPEGPKKTEPNAQSLVERGLKGFAILAIPMYLGSHIGAEVAPEGWKVVGSMVGAYTPPLVALGVILGNAWRNRNHHL